MGKLTSHILDTARGRPGGGIKISAFRLNQDGERIVVDEFHTNEDGRIDGTIAADDTFICGTYELDFHVGDYFRDSATPSFLDVVTIRFIVDNAEAHYHVPLLLSPFGYTTFGAVKLYKDSVNMSAF